MRPVAAGMTLLEVMIALLLLTVGAIALAAGIAASERARRGALADGLALAAAESWLEAWRASPWSDAGGAGGEDVAWGPWVGRLEWRVSLPGACLAEARVEVRVGADGAAALASRRFREGWPGCGP